MNRWFHPEFETDLIAAARFYETQRPRLGAEFLDKAEAAIETIMSAPLRWPARIGGVRRFLLASIVAERMKHNGEELYSLCSPLAVDAVSRSTVSQLKVLGLLSYMFCTSHAPGLPEETRAQIFFAKVAQFHDLKPREIDVLHLQSIACCSYERFTIYAPHTLVNRKFGEGVETWEILRKYGDLNPFLAVWNDVLMHCYPSSIGQLVGFAVMDLVHGTKTDVSSWGI